VELEEITKKLLAIVEETLQPEHARDKQPSSIFTPVHEHAA
jgi:hypothetical protein